MKKTEQSRKPPITKRKKKTRKLPKSFEEDWNSEIFPCRASKLCNGLIFYGKTAIKQHVVDEHDMNIEIYKEQFLKMKISPDSTEPEDSD